MTLLPLTLIAVGGLKNATTQLAQSKPLPTIQVALSSRDNGPSPDTAQESGTALKPGTLIRSGTTVLIQVRNEEFGIRLAEPVMINEFGAALVVRSNEIGRSSPLVNAVRLPFLPPSSGDDPTAGLARMQADEYRELIYEFGAYKANSYTSLPGPSEDKPQGFLPTSAAISFFFFWCFASAGQPGYLVRLMAFRDSKTLARAIFTVSVYFSLIYFPIVIIFCCARVLLPGWESASDRIMPEMASTVTSLFGVPWLAGLLVAAPFAAVMSTMDSYLLLISSSVVRDVYVRWIKPNPSEKQTKRITYATTLVVGLTAMIAAINPPQFLQDIIVFTGAGLATSFLVPVLLALYWPRFNAAGAIAGMLVGFFSNVVLYAIGSWQAGKMSAVEPFGFSPFMVGVACSLLAAWFVCLSTKPPEEELVLKFFYRRLQK